MNTRFQKYFTIILGLLLLVSTTGLTFAQNSKVKWDDYFSYGNIRHLFEVNGFIFASSENGFFIYDPNTQEIEKNSKVDELNDVGISSFTFNHELGFILIGYESGEIDILGEDENYNLLEIPLHQFYTGSKIVNHIFPFGNSAIISGEFGLASFDLTEQEFLETVYFTQANAYFAVNESIVFEGVIYAASEKGVYTHPMNEFIANFVAWEQVNQLPNTEFKQIVLFQNQILASTGDNIYLFDGENWSFWGNFPSLTNINVNGNVLSITQYTRVSNYDENLNLIDSHEYEHPLNIGIKVNNITYGGSRRYGLLRDNLSIKPDGPYNNQSWSVTAVQDQIWIAPGGIQNFFQPLSNPNGFYHFDGNQWIHYKSEDMLNARDVVDIEVNPNDITEFYVSTYLEFPSWNETSPNIGLLKFKNGQMVENYNEDNSTLIFRARIGGSRFDDEGNLWVQQSTAEPGYKSFMHKKTPNDTWESIDLLASGSDTGARKPFFYRDYVFAALPRSSSGLKMTDMNEVYTVDANVERGDLPSSEVPAVAVDMNGTLWIGTIMGLRVLYNPIESIKSGNFQTQPVIIEQDGIPEALLTDVQINDIAIDGANQKWVATETGGVYCFSSDGTKTVHHFTSGNSPLPSNKVNKIAIDNQSGVVFFATDKGLVSYRSDAVEVGDSFGDVYSYPNPVRPGFKGEVTIKGLPNDADVRIVDVVGNLIYHTKASGGVAKWDTRNMNGKYVASGIYLVLMTNKDASQSKQTKIAIVR